MKAAIMTAAGMSPAYGDFQEPGPAETGMERLRVTASALSQFSRSRSAGTHYSSDGVFPSIAGAEGVGHTEDGRRVYFVLPEAPFGALAEYTLVRQRQCVPVPDGLDDVTAAALANPGMSAWAALVERAKLQPAETVLIHGATGTAGRLAVQLARYLGAGKVIATGRNQAELEQLRVLGADTLIHFHLEPGQPEGGKHFERALLPVLQGGVDVVLDYLWGEGALALIIAIAKAVDDGKPVRFVHVGAASGTGEISLPGAALRSSAIQLMGSGVKSVPMPKLLEAIGHVFAAATPARLQVATRAVPLAAVTETWESAPGKPRIVFTIP